jgi:hypothetical protein
MNYLYFFGKENNPNHFFPSKGIISKHFLPFRGRIKVGTGLPKENSE